MVLTIHSVIMEVRAGLRYLEMPEDRLRTHGDSQLRRDGHSLSHYDAKPQPLASWL